MKKGIAVTGLLAIALAAHTAGAKTLEEVLKEKGVITEADFNEVMKGKPKTKPFNYKLGQGFTLTSDDEKYQLSLSGQMQFRYTFTDKGGNIVTGTSTSSEWKIPRIKTIFSGHVYTRDLTFRITPNWANLNSKVSGTSNSDTSKVLEETFANYRIVDEAQVRGGQDKVQFSRNWITASSQNQFVDTVFVNDAFRPGYDLGLGVHGNAMNGLVTYAAQWMGGKGQNTYSTGSNNNSYDVRVAVNPFGELKYSEADLDMSTKPLFSLGGSYYHNTLKLTAGTTLPTIESNQLNYANTTTGWLGKGVSFGQFGNSTQNVSVNTYEFDMAFKWSGLSAQTEYFWGQGEGSSKSLISKGFYAQAGYMIIPKTIELAMRYAWMDYNQDARDSLKSEVQWAASWYLNGHNLKVQADLTKSYLQRYVDTRAAAGSGVNDTIFRTQAQLLF